MMLWMSLVFAITVGFGMLTGVFAGGAVELLRGRQGTGLFSGMVGGMVGSLIGLGLYMICVEFLLYRRIIDPPPSYIVKLLILFIIGGNLLYTAVFVRRPQAVTSKERERKKAIDDMPIDERCLQLSSTLNDLDNRWDAMTPDDQRRMEEVVERIAAITGKASDIGITTGVFTEGEAVRIPKVSGLSIDEQLTCVELLAANIEEWQQGSDNLAQDGWRAVGVLKDIAYPRMGDNEDRDNE